MSRQLYAYALPREVEALLVELAAEMPVVFLRPTSTKPEPLWVDSVLSEDCLLPRPATCVSVCLASSGAAKIDLFRSSSHPVWRISEESEIIQLSGFDFDQKTLARGRFYFQTDFLAKGELFKKSPEFIGWAERLFSAARRKLMKSRTWDAYVGREAMAWQQSGGRFASLALPGRDPIVAEPRK